MRQVYAQGPVIYLGGGGWGCCKWGEGHQILWSQKEEGTKNLSSALARAIPVFVNIAAHLK